MRTKRSPNSSSSAFNGSSSSTSPCAWRKVTYLWSAMKKITSSSGISSIPLRVRALMWLRGPLPPEAGGLVSAASCTRFGREAFFNASARSSLRTGLTR